MKMQVAFLPGGKFALVLSKVKSDEVSREVMTEFSLGVRDQIGAASVMSFADDVELEGFAAHGPDQPQRTSSDALRDLYNRARVARSMVEEG
jgi:hypothetical protein